MKLKKLKVNVFFFIILFLIFTIKFDFFLNIYIILKNNNDARMISNYGYCYPKGYGFIQEMSSKYNLNDYNINTNNKMDLHSSDIFNFSFKKKKSLYEILINFKSEDLNIIKKKFKVIESQQKCHLIKYIND
jgi:hypothetical protein